jgi:hypothetical protein
LTLQGPSPPSASFLPVCPHLPGRAGCPALAFADPSNGEKCIAALQRRAVKIGKLRLHYVRPIVNSLPHLLSMSILQGDVDVLTGLLRGNERHCCPDYRSLLQFCQPIRSFDTCTFDYTSYHSPVEQPMYHCKRCGVDCCLVCALHCHSSCFDSKTGCAAAIEMNRELSARPSYCDCNKRTCRSMMRGVYDDSSDSALGGGSSSNNNNGAPPAQHAAGVGFVVSPHLQSFGGHKSLPPQLVKRLATVAPPEVGVCDCV